MTDGRIVVTTLNGLNDLQLAVGGNIEYAVSATRAKGTWHAYANEEGLLMDLPYNPTASDLLGRHIVGNVVFFGGVDDEGEERDITDEQLGHLLTGQARTAVIKHFNDSKEAGR